jgi:hypothetical protein
MSGPERPSRQVNCEIRTASRQKIARPYLAILNHVMEVERIACHGDHRARRRIKITPARAGRPFPGPRKSSSYPGSFGGQKRRLPRVLLRPAVWTRCTLCESSVSMGGDARRLSLTSLVNGDRGAAQLNGNRLLTSTGLLMEGLSRTVHDGFRVDYDTPRNLP